MCQKAVIFDLDGVIVSTDEFHYQAWKRLAEEHGIYFDRKINQRLLGVSRMESLEIILKQSNKHFSDSEKAELAAAKNSYYRSSLESLTPGDIFEGAIPLLNGLKEKGVKIAVGSSSRNAHFILSKIGLANCFDAVADGNEIKNSKPDPEVFLLAAHKLGVAPRLCIVIEDAQSGIEAALAGGMKAVGVGFASNCKNADLTAKSLLCLSAEKLLALDP